MIMSETFAFGIENEVERTRISRWLNGYFPALGFSNYSPHIFELFFDSLDYGHISEITKILSEIRDLIPPRDRHPIKIDAHARLDIIIEYLATIKVLKKSAESNEDDDDDLVRILGRIEMLDSARGDCLSRQVQYYWIQAREKFRPFAVLIANSLTRNLITGKEDLITRQEIIQPLFIKIVSLGFEEALTNLPTSTIVKCVNALYAMSETVEIKSRAHEVFTAVLENFIAIESFQNIRSQVLHLGRNSS